jgi:hypothetical protein
MCIFERAACEQHLIPNSDVLHSHQYLVVLIGPPRKVPRVGRLCDVCRDFATILG